MKDPAIFLNPDFRCPPFERPQLSKRTLTGDQVITYPADLTNDLLPPIPMKRSQPKRKRASKNDSEMKKEKVDLTTSFEAEFLAAQKRLLGEAAV